MLDLLAYQRRLGLMLMPIVYQQRSAATKFILGRNPRWSDRPNYLRCIAHERVTVGYTSHRQNVGNNEHAFWVRGYLSTIAAKNTRAIAFWQGERRGYVVAGIHLQMACEGITLGKV